MKISLKGWTKDGKLLILATVLISFGFLAGMFTMIKAVDFEGHIESQVFLSYSSALKGCVGQEQKPVGDKKNWEYCVALANAIAKETREILNKEPIKTFVNARSEGHNDVNL